MVRYWQVKEAIHVEPQRSKPHTYIYIGLKVSIRYEHGICLIYHKTDNKELFGKYF